MPQLRAALAALTVAASLAFAPAALADEPSAADSETALQLYKEGRALHEGGDDVGSLAKLKAAYALAQTPITALELGRAHARVGELVEARSVLLTVSRMPVRANESIKATEARGDADTLALELRPRLASLSVLPVDRRAAVPARITIDDVLIPPAAVGSARVLDPGTHVVVLEQNGQRSQLEVVLAEGQAREIEIALPAATVATPVVAAPPPSPEPGPRSRRSALVYAGFGTAAAGLVVGTVTGIMTLSKASSLDDRCIDGRCPPSAQDDIDGARALGTVSTVSFVIAGVGIAAGVVGLVWSTQRSPDTTAALRVSPGGVSGTF